MISFTVPCRADSSANLREHPMAKHRRLKAQAEAVELCLPKVLPAAQLEVRLVRLGVQELDTDNLEAALKAVRDRVAKWLRVDDATTLVKWTPSQEPCAPGSEAVRIEVESVHGGLLTVPAWVRVPGPPKAKKPRAPRKAELAEKPAQKDWRALVKPNVRRPR